jgi:putative membrane-bound dehydrogenase-like protein
MRNRFQIHWKVHRSVVKRAPIAMTSNPTPLVSVRAWSIWLVTAAAITISMACITLLAQPAAPQGTPAAAPKAAAKAAPAAAPRTAAPRRIEVLFLGADTPEHSSQKATALFVPSMAKEGINISWTDSVSDLNARNLAKYDVLMVYGNFDKISPAEETALVAYVAGGKGLVAIHSASDMFKNSAAWGKLIGGQLDHHGPVTTFTAAVKQANHAVVREFTPFETKDETYVHKNAAADRTVLMDRAEGSGREAVSWVRNEGKGRVFYTALGHDETTWKAADFTALLRGAILWTAGDAVRAQWEKLDMPSVSYKPSVFIPNYERRVPPLKFQEPLTPAASMKTMQVPPGFEVQLFASEPDITKPIAMNWDERGRLWVVESVDYPNDYYPLDKNYVGHDRIKICEDTDGDGKADKFTIFAEGLNIPTGITFWNNGVIVGAAPYMYYLQDTNGDDKADVKKIIQTGWGTRDTHSGIGNLQYGFDNYIWGSIGYSGYMGTTPDGKTMNFLQGIFRMHPDGTGMEFMGSFSNNTWGLGFSETFDLFGSTANNTHAVYVGIPPRYSADVKGLPVRPGSKKIDGHYYMAPDTFNVRQVDVMGGFTAANGFNLYTARVYPREYWNRIAFVNEPTGRVVHRAILEKDGAGFKEKDGWNLVSSTDEWFEPVLTQVGPDGQVWVADLYNFIVQHNPTPIGFENGRGGAYENPLRDHTYGRVYRIVYKGAPKVKPLSLSKQRPAELVAALSNDNMFWRTTAQRLLVERGNKDVVPQLTQLAASVKVDDMGLNPGALHALWTLEGLGATNGSNAAVTATVLAALKNPAAGVRKAALQILPANDTSLKAVRAAGLLNDKNPYTRLSAILFLTQFPPSDAIGAELYRLGKEKDVENDEFLNMAVHDAAAKNRAGFFKAMEADMGAAQFKDFAAKLAKDESTPKPAPVIPGQTQQGAGFVLPPDPIMPVGEGLLRAYVEDIVGPITRPAPANGGRGGGGGRGRGGPVIGPFQEVAININVAAMTYSVSSITAKPGEAIRITLNNTGDVLHNVVLIRPGSIDVVGAQVEAMAKVPNAEERSYLPPTPDILFWMKLVEIGKTGTLEFYAPNQPGDYPYLCTYPGHWQTMRGVLHVVAP